MSKSLTEYDKYKVIRPVIGGCEYDENSFPIIRNTFKDNTNWDELYACGIQNITKKNDNHNAIALMYLDDRKLLAYWNTPLKKIPLMLGCAAVATPDFSYYDSMNINEIRHNVFMNRWLGATWQNYGVNVIPTIGWAGEHTYDLCLCGVEEGTPVTISTLGCQKHEKEFLAGFNEMKQRIKPSIIIVFGDMIEGMTGRFLHFKYTDSFNKKIRQQPLKGMLGVFEIKEKA